MAFRRPDSPIPDEVVITDGGRAAAGFAAAAIGDCVCRAIAIAAEMDYAIVHDDLTRLCVGTGFAPDTGVSAKVFSPYLRNLGFRRFHPQEPMKFNPHLLPPGRLVVVAGTGAISHAVAVIDGVVHDASDTWYWHGRVDCYFVPENRMTKRHKRKWTPTPGRSTHDEVQEIMEHLGLRKTPDGKNFIMPTHLPVVIDGVVYLPAVYDDDEIPPTDTSS